ncbi:MAG: riboflavin synthase [Endomicrobium sp.]|jgi:riboflavin synthase|nr:riboflavin synthase [Endomicrobium sp.]
MFTGLIEDLGCVKRISSSQIAIDTKLDGISTGDSIAVNGVCLTAVSVKKGGFTADYSPQTDKVTILSFLKVNEIVNLERALTLLSRIAGHIVTGHVDGTGKIEIVEKQNRFYRILVSLDAKCAAHCVDKGSVAIDGISLTIAKVENSNIELFVIPETFNNTVLKFKKAGSLVNIETDILAKYVERFTKDNNSKGISLEMLKGNEFI